MYVVCGRSGAEGFSIWEFGKFLGKFPQVPKTQNLPPYMVSFGAGEGSGYQRWGIRSVRFPEIQN